MAEEHEPTPTVVNVGKNGNGVFTTANKAIGALSGTPILLVMVLLNVTFIGAAAYYLRSQQMNVTKLVDKILEHCLAHEPPK